MSLSIADTDCQSTPELFSASRPPAAAVAAVLRRLRTAYRSTTAEARPDMRDPGSAVALLEPADVIVLARCGRFPVRGADLAQVLAAPKRKRRAHSCIRMPRVRHYCGVEI